MDERPVINWTRQMLNRFECAYKEAVRTGKPQFVFDNNTFVVAYAKYLIEYLKGQFK